jgi:hypothetical protein
MVRTCRHTVPATYAAGVNLADDAAFLVAFGGDHRADRGAGLGGALLAGPGQIRHLMVGKGLFVGHFKNHKPVHDPQFVGGVRHGGEVVLGLTGYHARAAARALVEVDGHSPFDVEFFNC